MSKEIAKKFLEGIGENEQAVAALKDGPEDMDRLAVMAEVANAQGLDVTKEELGAAMDEIISERAAQTDRTAEDLKELSMEEMDQVAGGVNLYPRVCEDTFVSNDDCWFHDKCDLVLNWYEFGPRGLYGVQKARCTRTVKSTEWQEHDNS